MAEQRRVKRYDTKTGRIQPIEEPRSPVEPPMPVKTPEAVDMSGSTGIFRAVGEGEDIRRQQDDSPNPSAPAHL
ncbi:MAG: hypothetical protein DIU68_006360 [Chloroflexota bacterium]|nr:MAG: hypothetical protein DIU68_17830 [Chloroflexota bacterium]